MRSYWALTADRAWPRHSIQFLLNNPTWPTEWKQYTALMVHEHYMQSGDLSLTERNFDQLVNNTMWPFIDPASHLVNFTSSLVTPMCKWWEPSSICNSPICHNDSATFRAGVGDGGRSCDNIDWLPKFRAHFKFTPVNVVVNAFAVRGMVLLSALANATNRTDWGVRLASQAERTRGTH
jgi:alpha-L-rhamnosidase